MTGTMTHLSPMTSSALLAVSVLGALLDIRQTKVPGWLSIVGVILGIGLNLFVHGVDGLVTAAAGFSLAVSTYLVLYPLRGASLDRLKLMAPVGAIVGPWNWLMVCLFSTLGIPLAIVIALSTAHLRESGTTKGLIIRDVFRFLPPYYKLDELSRRRKNGTIPALEHLAAVAVLLFLASAAVLVRG